jgi:hypothetical protein
MIYIRFIVFILIIAGGVPAVGQWTNTANLQNAFINSLLAEDDTVYAATGGSGFFYSLDNGIQWNQSNTGLGQNLSTTSIARSGGYLFISTYSDHVFRSLLPGTEWSNAGSGISQNGVVDLISDSGVVYAGCVLAGVFRTTNNGVNWSRFALGEGDVLYSLHKNEAGFFIGLAGGGFRSTNNGVNWSPFGNGLLNCNMHSIESKPGFLFTGSDLGFFYSSDTGSSWVQSNSGLPQTWINDIIVVNGVLIAALRNSGIYYSVSNGLNWMPFNGGVTDTNITYLAYSEKFIYAGSNRGNIFRAPVNSLPVGVENLQSEQPQSFTLHQNYPNPFNPTTQIRFTLNRSSFVTLEIYDAQGSKVAELLKGIQYAGSYEIQFSGDNLAGGVYFCRLTVGNLSESIKLVLLK